MVPVDDFVPLVAAEAPGAPDPGIEAAVVDAATRFCTEALVWGHSGYAQDIREGQAQYFIPVPSDARIQSVMGVYLNGRRIVVRDEDAYPWGTQAKGTPHTAYLTDEDRVSLYPVPDADIPGGLVVRVALRPKRGAKSLPDVLWSRYQDGIRHGALAILMAQVGQSWSNPGMVDYHANMMRREISRARADRVRGRATGSVEVKRRRFV